MAHIEGVAAVVLAAGAGRRFAGGDKLHAELAGQALGLHCVAAARGAGIGPILAVVPHDAPERQALFRDAGCDLILNDGRSSAMGASIALGAARLAGMPAVDRALILLADMPLVDPALIAALLDRAEGHAAGACAAGDILSPPAIFARSLFERLAGLGDAAGGKRLLASLPDLARLEVPPDRLSDVDTVEALATLRAKAFLSGA